MIAEDLVTVASTCLPLHCARLIVEVPSTLVVLQSMCTLSIGITTLLYNFLLTTFRFPAVPDITCLHHVTS